MSLLSIRCVVLFVVTLLATVPLSGAGPGGWTRAAAMAAPPNDGEEWRRIDLIDQPEIRVSLIYLPESSPPDERFIGFELENRTGEPLRLRNAQYSFDEFRVEPYTRPPGFMPGVGGGPSGGPYDLLHRDGGPQPSLQARDMLQPGVTQVTLYTSVWMARDIANRIGLLPESAATVRSIVRFRVILDEDRTYTTPGDGIAFRFRRTAADEETVEELRRQLLRVLSEPSEPFSDTGRLKAWLAEPSIASAVSVDDLLLALRRHDQMTGSSIGAHINEHYPNDEAVINFWLQVIRERDHLLLRQLVEAPETRDVRLIEPLVKWVVTARPDTREYHGWRSALAVLSRHRDLMPDREATVALLGETVRARIYPSIAKGEVPHQSMHLLRSSFGDLTLAGDPASVPLLVPYLDRREILVDIRLMAVRMGAQVQVSMRVCDAAYNTILDLLELPGERFTLARGEGIPDAEAEYARRDAAIEQLKRQLEAEPR